MTPMIDVVFLLLIFFVCTASFQIAEEVLPSQLLAAGAGAETEAEPEPELDRIIIKLRRQPQGLAWQINESPQMHLSDVKTKLAAIAAIDASVPVVLDIGGEVPLGDAIDLYDVCRLVGLAKIQFAASVEPFGNSER